MPVDPAMHAPTDRKMKPMAQAIREQDHPKACAHASSMMAPAYPSSRSPSQSAPSAPGQASLPGRQWLEFAPAPSVKDP